MEGAERMTWAIEALERAAAARDAEAVEALATLLASAPQTAEDSGRILSALMVADDAA